MPIPRGSFGLGAPPESGHNTSRELYGNRIPGVTRPSGPVSRSGSPLPFTVDDNSASPPVERRRGSSGTAEASTQPDLTNVSRKLAFQRNVDILNGTVSLDANGFERTQAPSTDTLPSPGRNLMTQPGVRRSSAGSSDVLSGNESLEESSEMSARSPLSSPLRGIQSVTAASEEKPVAPSIVVSPELLSVSSIPNDVEDAPKAGEPSAIADNDVQKAREPAESASSLPLTPDEPVTPSSPPHKAASEPENSSPAATGPPSVVSLSAPLLSPTPPNFSNGTVVAQQDEDQSPVPRSLGTTSVSSDPVANMQAPVMPVSSIASWSNLQSSNLQTAARPSRAPSPTPSMIHQSDAGTSTPVAPPPLEEPKTTPRKSRSMSDANSTAQRTIIGLPANPPPAPDDENVDASYGVVTLGHSSPSNKSSFTSIVHQKVIETSPTTVPRQSITLSQKPPIRWITSDSAALPSPGYGDLATLLEEAALLEERLKQDETTSDLLRVVDSMRADMGQFELQPFSIESQQVAAPERQHEESDAVPPTPPPKGFTRVLSGMKKLTSSGTLRSVPSAHSRLSTSGSELSSEDSACVGTPSDNELQYLASSSSFDRYSVGGLGIRHPSSPSKKSVSSIGRAGSFADRLWHRSRTKTINSSGKLPVSQSCWVTLIMGSYFQKTEILQASVVSAVKVAVLFHQGKSAKTPNHFLLSPPSPSHHSWKRTDQKGSAVQSRGYHNRLRIQTRPRHQSPLKELFLTNPSTMLSLPSHRKFHSLCHSLDILWIQGLL